MVSMRSSTRVSGEGRLRMAVPKGALWDGSLAVLARAGVDVSALEGADRQMALSGAEMDFVIARPTDIPAYVAYGAVDVAIAGKDSLVEADLEVVVLTDLKFGGCRFVVAELEGAREEIEERYRHLGVMTVATKYPRVAQAHFSAAGVATEIVKLHGNIELAPLIGLADRIVDITATGRTLAENGLVVAEEVMTSTARLVANPVAVAMNGEVLNALADRMEAAATSIEGEA